MNSLMSNGASSLARRQPQQVLGEQDADDLLAILVHDRKARVAALDHGLEQHVGFVVAIEHRHLRARHHDVAHLDVGDAEHAFEHGERVAFDDSRNAASRRYSTTSPRSCTSPPILRDSLRSQRPLAPVDSRSLSLSFLCSWRSQVGIPDPESFQHGNLAALHAQPFAASQSRGRSRPGAATP